MTDGVDRACSIDWGCESCKWKPDLGADGWTILMWVMIRNNV